MAFDDLVPTSPFDLTLFYFLQSQPLPHKFMPEPVHLHFFILDRHLQFLHSQRHFTDSSLILQNLFLKINNNFPLLLQLLNKQHFLVPNRLVHTFLNIADKLLGDLRYLFGFELELWQGRDHLFQFG